MEFGFYNMDCIEGMKKINDNSIDMVLTDIPYDGVNATKKIRVGTPLRELRKGKADILTFDMQEFLSEIYRVCKGSICIFCGIRQVSEIYNYFFDKQIVGGGYSSSVNLA